MARPRRARAVDDMPRRLGHRRWSTSQASRHRKDCSASETATGHPSVKCVEPDCDLILPCRDEAAALRMLLPRVPARFHVIVVDNGSSDDTAAVAARGRRAWSRSRGPDTARPCTRAWSRRTRDHVAVMDGDGSFDPDDLVPLLEDVRNGRADLAIGRRRPTSRGVWPWHARLGNRAVVWLLRRRGFVAHDIAPIRVARRDELLALDVQDRRFGYPVELMQRATAEGWRITEHGRALPPARRGHAIEGVRLRRGHGPGRPRLLEGDHVTSCGSARPRRRQGPGARAGQDPARRPDRDDDPPPTSPPLPCSTPWTPASRCSGRGTATWR